MTPGHSLGRWVGPYGRFVGEDDWNTAVLGQNRFNMNPNPSPPAVLHSPGFSHHNLAWSPFHTTRIAVASSANYGIIGNGRLHIASVFSNPSGVPDLKLEKLYVRVLRPFSLVKLK